MPSYLIDYENSHGQWSQDIQTLHTRQALALHLFNAMNQGSRNFHVKDIATMEVIHVVESHSGMPHT